MRKFRLGLLLFLNLLFINTASAQFFLGETDPASVKWSKIEGPTYKLIFPREIDSLAKNYLWLLEQNKNALMIGLGGIKPAKIPVILHNRTSLSNGMVVWAPKRVELYIQPANDTYSGKWDETLVIHEQRHVGQMTFFTKGFYNIASYFLGQQISGLGVGVYPSKWMLEGDAVVAETELTNSGRGREASFMEYYRASFLEKDYRGWDKWRFGSYKYYTPNIYAMGYLINSTIRYKTKKYDYAGSILSTFVKRFYNPCVKNFNYRKHVGATPKQYLLSGTQLMDSIWTSELVNRGLFSNGQSLLSKDDEYYTQYKSPVVIGKDSVLLIKSSYKNPSCLILVSNGKEEVLRAFSGSVKSFQVYGENIYFCENIVSPRWSNAVYNNLYCYNYKSKSMKKLSSKLYYSKPSVSPGGDSLAVTQTFTDGSTALTILDSKNAKVLSTFAAPSNGQVLESVFTKGYVYALVNTFRGIGLYRINLSGRKVIWESVIEAQPAKIYYLRNMGDDNLCFVADFDGVNNIYQLLVQDMSIRRLTNAKYGAYDPCIYNNNLYYTNLKTNGIFPAKLNLSNLQDCKSKYTPYLKGKKIENKYTYPVAEQLSKQARQALANNNCIAPDSIINKRNGTSIVKYNESAEEFAKNIEVKKYSKIGNLFRFHSWAPFYYNVDELLNVSYDRMYEVLSLGATFYSQNSLNTAVTMLGYSYRNGFHAGHFSFRYSGLLPVIKVTADINDKQRYQYRMQKVNGTHKMTVTPLNSAKINTDVLAYIPVNLSSHGWNRGFVPQAKWEYSNNMFYNEKSSKYVGNQLVSFAMQYYQLRPVAKFAIYPKWGFGAIIKNEFAPQGGNLFGSAVSAYAYGYIPGFVPAQGIRLSLSYQRQFAKNKFYYLDNMVNMPRGIDSDVFGRDYFMTTFDYAIPVYLKDINLGWFAYLQRLQLIPFADFATYNNKKSNASTMINNNIYSVGLTALVDCYFLRIGLPFSVGLRYSYNGGKDLSGQKNNMLQFIFSTSLY